jgi:hypothetical protein
MQCRTSGEIAYKLTSEEEEEILNRVMDEFISDVIKQENGSSFAAALLNK